MRLLRTSKGPERLAKVTAAVAAVRAGAHTRTLVRAGLMAGSLAALTAGSAAVSALRRRIEAE